MKRKFIFGCLAVALMSLGSLFTNTNSTAVFAADPVDVTINVEDINIFLDDCSESAFTFKLLKTNKLTNKTKYVETDVTLNKLTIEREGVTTSYPATIEKYGALKYRVNMADTDSWGGAAAYSLIDGDILTLNGSFFRNDGNGDFISFNEFTIYKTATGYSTTKPKSSKVEINKDTIKLINTDEQHTGADKYVVVNFSMEETNAIVVNPAWNYAQNKGFDAVGALKYYKLGETTPTAVKDINLVKVTEYKYSIIMINWPSHDSYTGIGDVIQAGDYIHLDGSTTHTDTGSPVIINFDLVLTYAAGGFMITTENTEFITLDYSEKDSFGKGSVTTSGANGSDNIYIKVDSYLPEDKIYAGEDGSGDWETQIKGKNDITVYHANGTTTTLNSVIVKTRDNNQDTDFFCFEFVYWAHNHIDFQAGDRVHIHTNAMHIQGDYIFTLIFDVNVYYSETFKDSDPWMGEEEFAAVQNTIDLIQNIGTITYTEECANAIKVARTAYSALTSKQQGALNEIYYNALLAAEEGYSALEMQILTERAVNLIDAIGTVTYTDASKEAIEAARAAYDVLNEETKAAFPNEKLQALLDAEYAYQDYKDRDEADKTTSLIDSIGEVAFTDDCANKIASARAAYDALTVKGKTYVANYNTLLAAESAYVAARNAARVNDVVTLINAIGEVDGTYVSKYKINEARHAYEFLDNSVKADVTNYTTLTTAEETFTTILNTQKETALAEVNKVIANLDLTRYTAEDAAAIGQLIADVKEAIEAQEAIDDLNDLVVDFTGNIKAFKTVSTGGQVTSVPAIIITGVVILALAGAIAGIIIYKKKHNVVAE